LRVQKGKTTRRGRRKEKEKGERKKKQLEPIPKKTELEGGHQKKLGLYRKKATDVPTRGPGDANEKEDTTPVHSQPIKGGAGYAAYPVCHTDRLENEERERKPGERKKKSEEKIKDQP